MSGNLGMGYPRRMTPRGFVLWLAEFRSADAAAFNIVLYGKPRVRVKAVGVRADGSIRMGCQFWRNREESTNAR